MLEGVGGFLALALFLIWWRLGSILAELKSLNHKSEFWGKDQSSNAHDLHALVADLGASASTTAGATETLANRVDQYFPAEREIERRRYE